MTNPEPHKAPSPLPPALASRVEQRLKAALDAQQRKDAIPHRVATSPAPLSFAQQRLWFLSQWDTGSALYNVPLARRLTGALDVAALEKALSGLVARHEALRTTVAVVDGEPVQQVAPPAHVQLPLTDLTGLPPETREAEAARLAREDAERALDLTAGPVLRARLLRLAPDDHTLLLVIHHIAFDGWSVRILDREMGVLYEAARANREPPLARLAIQYADYAEWQRRHLAGPPLERGLAHWRTRLEGAPVLDLPADKPRPPQRANRGARVAFTLPDETVQHLRAFCRAGAVTPFMPLLAAFEALLHAWSGQTDLCIGTPVAGRTRPEVEPLIGFFVNTLALRTDVSGDPAFRELLARVRETCLQAYTHQEIPFEHLVEHLQPARDPARTPLFQTMFAHHTAEAEGTRWGDLQVRPQAVEAGVSKFDLGLYLTESPTRIDASLEYNTDLFEPATVERVAAQYLAVLAAALAEPDAPLSRLTSGVPRATPHAPLEGPAPPAPRPQAAETPTTETETENRLAEVWKALLGLPHIRPEDNFFHLGGHSLLALKLAARIEATFGVKLALPAIFSAQTLREMARVIDAAKPAAAPSRTIRPAARGSYRVGAGTDGTPAKRE